MNYRGSAVTKAHDAPVVSVVISVDSVVISVDSGGGMKSK